MSSHPFSFSGKRALVTGAVTGIAIALSNTLGAQTSNLASSGLIAGGSNKQNEWCIQIKNIDAKANLVEPRAFALIKERNR